jgi:hypothetical protein
MGEIQKLKGDCCEMPENQYSKYIVKARANQEERLGKVVHLFGGKHFQGTNFSPAWVGITAPLFMMKEGHTHDYDEYLFFWGVNAADIDEFDAKVDLCLGEEQETHTITEPSVVYVPGGLKHCPLNFRIVNKPVMFMDISIYPEYQKK